jgi:hypothetical protein
VAVLIARVTQDGRSVRYNLRFIDKGHIGASLIALTPRQAHDSTAAEALLANLKASATLLVDKAYDSSAIRQQAQEQDVRESIQPKSKRKGSFAFSAFLYRYSASPTSLNISAVLPSATTRPGNILAAIKLVSARIWIR